MTDQSLISLEYRISALEKRLAPLEDAESIRNLKSRYAAYCDDNYNPDGIAGLFTEDAVWESKGLGRYEGREEIREFFVRASGIFTFAIHYSLNAEIHVAGDSAQAQWYLFMPCTIGDGNQAMWRAGIDKEKYTRVNGVWLFSEKTSAPMFSTPFDKGWAEQRFS